MSWFTRNTKNWHIVYDWSSYSKLIINDHLFFWISNEPQQYEHSSKRETIRNIIVRLLFRIPYFRESIILKLIRKIQVKLQSW